MKYQNSIIRGGLGIVRYAEAVSRAIKEGYTLATSPKDRAGIIYLSDLLKEAERFDADPNHEFECWSYRRLPYGRAAIQRSDKKEAYICLRPPIL